VNVCTFASRVRCGPGSMFWSRSPAIFNWPSAFLLRMAPKFAKAWNFGPDAGGDATVGEIAETTARLWGEGARVECASSTEHPHEAGSLRLDSTLARTELGWRPRWPLDEALAQTVAWYRAWALGADMAAISLDQIRAYEAAGQS